jgi:hypothetical protein
LHYHVGLSGNKTPKIQLEAPKKMKSGGGLEDVPIGQEDVEIIYQST